MAIPRNIPLPDAVNQMIDMLEKCRAEFPFAEEELNRHRMLQNALDEQRVKGDQTLTAWREALSHRWDCEVHAQRTYKAIQQLLSDFVGSDATYLQLVAPAHPSSAQTPTDLLNDLRRIEASLSLLRPRPPFAEQSLAQLRVAIEQLAVAIERTDHCETERRSAQIEQRMAANLYERVFEKTRRLMAAHTGNAKPSML